MNLIQRDTADLADLAADIIIAVAETIAAVLFFAMIIVWWVLT